MLGNQNCLKEKNQAYILFPLKIIPQGYQINDERRLPYTIVTIKHRL